MGKSYKKYPIVGNLNDSDQPYKRQSHRRSRKNSKQALREKVFFEEDYDILGEDFENKDYGNVYYSMKDGKTKRFLSDDYNDEDLTKYYRK